MKGAAAQLRRTRRERGRRGPARVGSIRDLFVGGLSTAADVARWTGLPYLGAIPKAQVPASQLNPAAAVVEYDDPALAAAFRRLHADLWRASPRAQVVALTSALPKDGKTTCSVALARQSALSGHRTVLVDCDLRRRSASVELGGPAAVGLLEVVTGQATLDQAIHRDGFTGLYYLPVSSDLDLVRRAVVKDVLSGPLMMQLLAALRARFDHVFIDTPPLLAVADTRLLASLADAFLFVTRWRKTPTASVTLALELLNSTGAAVAGLALTRAPRSEAAAPLVPQASPTLARQLA